MVERLNSLQSIESKIERTKKELANLEIKRYKIIGRKTIQCYCCYIPNKISNIDLVVENTTLFFKCEHCNQYNSLTTTLYPLSFYQSNLYYTIFMDRYGKSFSSIKYVEKHKKCNDFYNTELIDKVFKYFSKEEFKKEICDRIPSISYKDFQKIIGE